MSRLLSHAGKVGVTFIAALVVGCSGASEPTAAGEVRSEAGTPPVERTASRSDATPVADLAPTVIEDAHDVPAQAAEQRTGVREVDVLIDALLGVDIAALSDAVRFAEFDCAGIGLGLPATFCLEGSASGHVAVLPRVGCSLAFLPETDLVEELQAFVGAAPVLHSVVLAPTSFRPSATHIINFATAVAVDARSHARGLIVADGQIVGLRAAGCPSEEFEDLYPPEYLTPPPGLQEPLDQERRTGIDVVDRLLDAYAMGDPEAVLAFVRPTAVPCGGTNEPRADCRAGEADGTVVDAVLLSSCHAAYVRLDDLAPYKYVNPRGEALFAVTATGGQFFESEGLEAARYAVILATVDQTDGRALLLDDDGIVGILGGCGIAQPHSFVRSTPSDTEFLLAPASSPR